MGTWFRATGYRKSVQELWLEHLADIRGTITVDAGAAAAVRRRSLLAAGIVDATGGFDSGDAVALVDENNKLIAHGISSYTVAETLRIRGRHSDDIAEILGEGNDGTVVHADNILVLN